MKKNIKWAAAIFCGMIMLGGVAAEAENYGSWPIAVATGRAYSNNWSDDYGVNLCEVEYPAVYLMNGYEELYPEMSATLDDVNELRLQYATEGYDEMTDYALEDVQNRSVNDWRTLYRKEKVTVRRADDRVVSLMFLNESDYGGVHGYYSYWGENYDTQTGSLIYLSDVLTDPVAFKEVLQEKLDEYRPNLAAISDYPVEDFFAQRDEIDVSWTLDYNGVTVYFNPYDIASYADGAQIITIGFEEYPELFREEYLSYCDSYGVQLGSGEPFYYDFDNDGILDELMIYGIPNGYDANNGHTIYLNGIPYQDEDYFFAMDPTFIHMSDGNNYLYIQNVMENDYRQIGIYKLESDVKEVGTFGGGYNTYPYFGSYFVEDALTNPDGFYLQARSHVLGTSSGNKYFHVGEDGMPVSDESAYTLNYTNDLQVMQDLEADLLDEYGENVIGKVTLYPGAYVRPVRTDLETFADLMMEDGRYCRVAVNTEQWPQTVNGVDIEQLFDGIMFAG